MNYSLTIVLLFFVVNVFGQELKPFKLNEVEILECEFKHAEDLDAQYILAHNVDRLLAPFLIDAGIEPKAERYGNWENTGLDGHIGGHYLTALAQMVAVHDDPEMLRRLQYMLKELRACQLKNGDGYVGGIPGGHTMWNEIRTGEIHAGGFSLNGKWVPLYNIHKLFAGLRDAYLIADQELAKTMLIDLANYFYDLLNPLSDSQLQDMLRSEHGGMNEVFADVAEITGDMKYLKLAKRFSHKVILEPLSKHEDRLNGLHANTQIPKIIGFEKIAEVGDAPEYHEAAKFFWEMVVNHRTVTIGGNSVREHFHPDSDFSSMVESKEGPESCNTYNMLRLSNKLFFTENDLKYIDYYEQALYNHILSTQHPQHGGMVYFTPMRPRHYRVYSKPGEAFWCCVGSGIENHGKYGELIYAHDDKNVYVNLFIPSKLNWDKKGIKLVQTNNFPNESNTTVEVELKKAKKFTIYFRYPAWVENGALSVTVNGKNYDIEGNPGNYIAITRKWKNGDEINVDMPMKLKAIDLPDHSDFVSFMYGPIVLAAKTDTSDLDGLIADDSRMGHIANDKLYPLEDAPSFIVNDFKNIKISQVENAPLTFEFDTNLVPEKYEGLTLEPFYRIHDARYEVYFPYATPQEYATKQAELKRKEEERLALEVQTIDQVGTGEQQPESDHNFKAEDSQAGVHRDRHWRTATKWFSYDLRDPEREAKKLRLMYYGQDRGRKFNVRINNQLIAIVELNGEQGAKFYEVDYDIPSEIIENSNGILELKFEAVDNKIAGGIYYLRLMK